MRFATFRQRHPILWTALLWSLPAFAVGLTLRLIFLHYSPYAYWGADSPSFFGFTNGALTKFYFSINEKRRYLYPVLMLPISLLPGGTLRWLGWIQALLGLATLLPLAYVIRRVFTHWRWWIIPLLLIYTGLPLLIWQEHELIADTIFFDAFVWMVGGWVAWTVQADPARARRLFWWFLGGAAVMVLTKPSGIFFWPGVCLGLLVVKAWRTLRWREWLASILVVAASLTAGDHTQSAWLLYSTAFPLTRLETPLHHNYKDEIKDMVEKSRARVNAYHAEDDSINRFLRGPKDPGRPLWRELGKHKDKMAKVYHDLAIEAILARPDLFLLIGMQRLFGSCNPGDFRDSHFTATYAADRFKDTYNDKRIPESMLRIAFGVPKDAPLPSFEAIKAEIAPHPDSAAAKWFRSYAHFYAAKGKILNRPKDKNAPPTTYRLTALGWWLLAGFALSFLSPWRRTLGVWSLAVAGYLFAIYLVGIQQTRYFGAVWPVLILLLAVVPEAALLGVARWRAQRATSAPTPK